MSNDDLQRKLNSLRRHIVTPVEPSVSRPPGECDLAGDFPKRYHAMAGRLAGELVPSDSGCYVLVRTLYPWQHRFGDCSMETPESSEIPLSAYSRDHVAGDVPLESMLFFDTETTGLGGSGAVAFLIGLGSITSEGFEVRQYLLPDYSDETAMLEDVLAEVTSRPGLVSYNGAAFDLPLVRDRMIINRVARAVEPEAHIDLLHPTRRLFRRRLQDCTLTNIEREIFHFYREGDIPGYLIPSVYFDWLGQENLDEMVSVLEHNRLDILALFHLLLHIRDVFVSGGKTLEAADDIYSLSRVLNNRKETAKVVELLNRVASESDSVSDDIVLFNAQALKRQGDLEGAVALWSRLADTRGREGFEANVELAKYFEHRTCDYDAALGCVRVAEKIVPDSPCQRRMLEHRRTRLTHKIDKKADGFDNPT